MVVLGEKAPKLLKCIPIDSTSFGSYSPYQNLLISSTSGASARGAASASSRAGGGASSGATASWRGTVLPSAFY